MDGKRRALLVAGMRAKLSIKTIEAEQGRRAVVAAKKERRAAARAAGAAPTPGEIEIAPADFTVTLREPVSGGSPLGKPQREIGHRVGPTQTVVGHQPGVVAPDPNVRWLYEVLCAECGGRRLLLVADLGNGKHRSCPSETCVRMRLEMPDLSDQIKFGQMTGDRISAYIEQLRRDAE